MSERERRGGRIAQPGYSTPGPKQEPAPGWCHPAPAEPEPPQSDRGKTPDYLKNISEERMTLFGADDELLAIATQRHLVVIGARASNRSQAHPFAEVRLPVPLTRIVATGSSKPLQVVAADAEGKLWTYDFTHRGPRRRRRPVARKPVVRPIAEPIAGTIIGLLPTRRHLFVQTERAGGGYRLYAVERRTHRLQHLGDLDLDRRLTVLDSRDDKLLVGYQQGEVRLIEVDRKTPAAALTVHSLDVPRVTAAAMLGGRHLLVAQKGGQLVRVDVNAASAKLASNPSDLFARACKRLCEVLRRCGGPPCGCQEPGERPEADGEPDPNGSGDHPRDQTPCDDRRSIKLTWTVARLAVAGRYVLAFSEGNRRMAVFDQNLNLSFERFIGHAGAAVSTGQARTHALAMVDARHHRLERWSLADYVRTLPGWRAEEERPAPAPPSTVTYYGQPHHRGAPNPDLKVCLFTVVEPGQAFTDPDQNVLMAQIESRLFDVVNDYYFENSFGDLDVRFSVFGHDFGGTGTPLVLPRPIASYFYDSFRPGGLQVVAPADWGDPVVLDGTETLVLRTHPRVGTGKEYSVPFAALWTAADHGVYPVVVSFDGSETLELTVEDQAGNTHVLALSFGALSLTLAQGDDEAAFLSALAAHFTSAVRAAEAALPGAPQVVQDVLFRRIRLTSDPNRFGQLQGQLRVAAAAPSDFVQKGTIAITAAPPLLPTALQATGFGVGNGSSGTWTSAGQTRTYLEACLAAAQADAGEGPGLNDPHLNTRPSVTEDVIAQELTLVVSLGNNKGGAGARIEVVEHAGHEASGFATGTPLPGSESTVNNQSTLRDVVELADDVFTAALDRLRSLEPWNADAARALFGDFDVMLIGFVGQASSSIPVGDRWGVGNPADFGRLRMFKRTHFATDRNNPNPSDPPVSMGTSRIIGQKLTGTGAGVLAHELGHALDLPDLYSASGFRDDVLYVDPWCMMGGSNETFNHFCGWSKWVLGWVAEHGDDALNRVVEVPLPAAASAESTEAWLVPVEYWDAAIKTDVRAVVGGTLPIAQLMKIHLGSDAGVVNLVELRAPGLAYSQNLPPSPAVIATNVLAPGEDRRWAVNGLYRRSVHQLNPDGALRAAGDDWDFAAGREFPLKGCTARVVDVQSIRGGSIPLFRVRIDREQAEFVDLHFQDHAPSWRSPDLWIDWPGDNPDASAPRVYPIGTPTDQGETVRFPASGVERHFMVARVHNAGNVQAEQVKVRWFICDPPGAGDSGRWVERDTLTLASVAPGGAEIAAFDWLVDSSTNDHQCLRAEIIDWSIPAGVDPATGDTVQLASDDVKLQNNNAQQNVFDFEALAGSPFDPIDFQMQVHNDNVETEIARLVPDGLPWGARLDITPSEAHIPPGAGRIFQCQLRLDHRIIRPGCDNDKPFLLTAWRIAEDADVKWGSCLYHLRPRYKTELRIDQGYWAYERLGLSGRLELVTSDPVDASGEFPLEVRIRLSFRAQAGETVVWRRAWVDANGHFSLDLRGGLAAADGHAVTVQAWFDRTNLLGSSVSEPRDLKRSVLI